MKIAALYDIHGNLPALNAVLKELQEEIQPDLIVIGGDMLPGPLPGPTLERLIQLGKQARFIRGNGDREVVTAFDKRPLSPTTSEAAIQEALWSAGELTRSQRDFLADLPEQITLTVEGWGDILFCHATPRNDEEIFTPITPQERLKNIFAATEQQAVVCGHIHVQFEKQVEGIHILNAGSVGMPYADRPGAYWLLLSPEGHEFRWTNYDLEAAAQELGASTSPYAQAFVAENVLTIPTAAEAIEAFEPRS